ncbi:hypothetical protein [Acinetobacter lwoffii]|uniref:histidine kinase n=1 Tax=Acinetobacter lwoffii NIPH 478 TaxID=1217668 RepID=N9HRZ2_ACILW|nr:hypothetical protein [Acinetobacter lwoffii]ENW32346.1 hypothetical protein F923_00085 [Acinetobacter lwoffii NIPH 478]
MNDATHYLKTLDAKVMPSKVQSFAQNSKHLIHKLHQNLENEKVFSSYAAHELRSPLTAIKTHIQLAQLMATGKLAQIATELAAGTPWYPPMYPATGTASSTFLYRSSTE